jgi:hypothetical protein
MARKDRVSMDRHAQVLELHERGYSSRRIAQTLKMCKKSVGKYIKRPLSKPNLMVQTQNTSDDPQAPTVDPNAIILQFPNWLQDMDWQTLLKERAKGVSVKILYKEVGNAAVSYWAFWSALKRLSALLNPEIPKTTMRLVHKPGEKTFVDYGDGIDIVDFTTGEITKTWIFVGTLPFSSKVFAEFVFNQKLASFISSHEKMWDAFGGVTQYTVPDNLKSAVTKAHLYDPDLNKTFCAYANHAGFAVLPARPRRPKDKANVETHVGLLQRSFFQEVRNKNFHTISELNNALTKHLEILNNQVMKDHGVSRNQRFETESNLLLPLPKCVFEIPEVREATVHPDCHIQYGRSFYSVPWQYVGKQVRVIATASRVQIFDLLTLERIALHSAARKNGERKTDELHWPPEKKEHCDFTAERACQDAAKIGPQTAKMFGFLFSLSHPLQYLRRTQGWLRKVSTAKCSRAAMEYAATMALQHKNFGSNYVNDCASYFDAGGLQRPTQTGAPKREHNTLYLQKDIAK